MARRKVHHGYITNPAARRLSLKKRKKHILKKVEELTILCGIEGCVIIYSPGEAEPTFWPSQLQVEYMLRAYESIPEIHKCSKKISLETYLKDSVKKLENQINNVESTNAELENTNFLNQIYRSGRTFRDFQTSELVGLKGFVEERKKTLGKRMQFQGLGNESVSDEELAEDYVEEGGSVLGKMIQFQNLSIREGNEPMSDKEPAEEPENRIEDTDPAILEEWFINMMKETQYEVSSSSNSVPAGKQKAVDDVLDNAAMSTTDQGNGINQDSSMFGVNPGQHGVIVATSYHTVEIYTGNPQGINNQVVEDNVGGGSGINEINQLPHQGPSTFGINNLSEIGDNGMEFYYENPDEGINNGGGNNDLLGGAYNINAAMIPHGSGHTPNVGQGSVNIDGSNKENDNQKDPRVTVFNQSPEVPINGNAGAVHGWLPDYGLTEGSHHGILDFPNNNNMFSATLPSSNSMDVVQPDYVSYVTYYDIDGGNGGDNMTQQPGNQ